MSLKYYILPEQYIEDIQLISSMTTKVRKNIQKNTSKKSRKNNDSDPSKKFERYLDLGILKEKYRVIYENVSNVEEYWQSQESLVSVPDESKILKKSDSCSLKDSSHQRNQIESSSQDKSGPENEDKPKTNSRLESGLESESPNSNSDSKTADNGLIEDTPEGLNESGDKKDKESIEQVSGGSQSKKSSNQESSQSAKSTEQDQEKGQDQDQEKGQDQESSSESLEDKEVHKIKVTKIVDLIAEHLAENMNKHLSELSDDAEKLAKELYETLGESFNRKRTKEGVLKGWDEFNELLIAYEKSDEEMPEKFLELWAIMKMIEFRLGPRFNFTEKEWKLRVLFEEINLNPKTKVFLDYAFEQFNSNS